MTSPLLPTSLRRGTLCALLVGMFAITGCDNAIDTVYREQIVVGAFILAGQPIDSVVLHRTTPFGMYYEDLAYAVDSAQVTVTVDGVPHGLVAGTRKGRYYLPASDLIVQGGKTYTLTIIAPNHQTGGTHSIIGETTVPMPIHLSALADSIRGKTFVLDTNSLSSFAFVVTAGPVDKPNRKYILTVTGLDTSFGRINMRRFGPDMDSDAVTKYSDPQTGPAIAVTPDLLNWYGPNRLTFYAIDTNWWDYQRQVPRFGATNYQASLNHIQGGMGIFASGASDTVSIFLKPKE